MNLAKVKTWIKTHRKQAGLTAAAAAVIALALWRRRQAQQGTVTGIQPQEAAATDGSYEQFTAALGQLADQQAQQSGVIYDALGQIGQSVAQGQSSLADAMAQNAAYQTDVTASWFGSLFDSLGALLASEPASPAAPRTGSTVYTFAAGDTIASVAAKYGLTAAQLLAANPKSGANFDAVGHRITIPTSTAAPAATTAKPTIRYTFAAGESYATVAARYGLTEAQLRAMNPTAGKNSGQAGTSITIRG